MKTTHHLLLSVLLAVFMACGDESKQDTTDEGGNPQNTNCIDNFELGSTFQQGNDTYAECDGSFPGNNCLTGNSIYFNDTKKCQCIVSCERLVGDLKEGDDCSGDEASVTHRCKFISNSNGTSRGLFCIPDDYQYNLCGSYSPAVCGDGKVGYKEVCDKNKVYCDEINFDYTEGEAVCKSDCTGYDVSNCSSW